MGCYHIRLTKNASELCAIILPWDKYKYELLTMRVINPMEILQDKTNEMFLGLNLIWAYIDDLSVLTNGDGYDPLDNLEQLLINLDKKGINAT